MRSNRHSVYGIVCETTHAALERLYSQEWVGCYLPEAVIAEMDAAGPAGRAFREFALGFNPLLAVPEQQPWIPYYGYGAGVVRLSLGDNSELGGEVSGGYVRWNFFTDTTVTVDGEVWVRDGKLVR